MPKKGIKPPGPKPVFNILCSCEKKRRKTFSKQMTKWLAEQAEWQLYLQNREIVERYKVGDRPEWFQDIICKIERFGSATIVCSKLFDCQSPDVDQDVNYSQVMYHSKTVGEIIEMLNTFRFSITQKRSMTMIDKSTDLSIYNGQCELYPEYSITLTISN